MKYVWRIFPYLCVDYKAAQAWLERQGAEGLRLAGVHCRYLARFTREERPVHYFVDLAADGGADYLQLCADAGWERVAQVQAEGVEEHHPQHGRPHQLRAEAA